MKRSIMYPILIIFVAVVMMTIFRMIGLSRVTVDSGSISASPAIELER
ncbi:MAG: hypothetical protein R2883_04270 [Caldisericia bacterium]